MTAIHPTARRLSFNTRFFYRDYTDEEKDRYLDANQRFLRKAKARGVQIAVGSDAHSPKDQGGAFEVALHVLDALDINEIVFPLAGQLRRVALRRFDQTPLFRLPALAGANSLFRFAAGHHSSIYINCARAERLRGPDIEAGLLRFLAQEVE